MAPEIAGVVASYDRTDALLQGHPLALNGTLRHIRRPPGSSPPTGINRFTTRSRPPDRVGT